MKKLIVLILLLIFTGIANSPITNFNVTVEGRDVRITWEVLDPTGIRHFDVERSASNVDQFVKINTSPIFINDSKQYTYIDQSLYKFDETMVFYRVGSVDMVGNVTYSESRALGKISSVRRTWGSIKSMFR